MSILFFTACSSADSNPESADGGSDNQVFYVNPYKSECTIDGELQLCYVTSLGDSGDFAPYTGDIQNFEYEWGYGYALKGSGDAGVFLVEEVANETAEPGGVHFPLTITGGNGRIVEISTGLFEFYGEKSFICTAEAGCDSLKSVIDREDQIVFKFESPDNPADPYVLLSWESDTVTAQVGEEPGLVGITWFMDSFTMSKDNVQTIITGSEITAVFTLDEGFS